MELSNFNDQNKRRELLEKKLNIKLNKIKEVSFDNPSNVYCENLIGATTVPLGVAGPLLVNGINIKGNYYVPMATTEGALVASVNRGCKAISLSNGATTALENVGITRGPVFETKGIKESLYLKKWLQDNFLLIKQITEKTSSHLKLIKLDVSISGRYVYIRFYFNTEEAMGMNMVTIATDRAVDFIKQETQVNCLSLSGNYCVDKKPAWLNFISGRGRRVWAETTISKKTAVSVLKTTPEKIFNTWLSKCMLGSAMSGSLGFNSHFANIVAAIFIATGQDPGHIVEGSMGLTTAKIMKDGSLYLSTYLPALMVGTVGGGTKLKIKKEALSIIGVNKADQLVEVIGGAVLAGELSLLASLSEGSLVKAHKKLGR